MSEIIHDLPPEVPFLPVLKLTSSAKELATVYLLVFSSESFFVPCLFYLVEPGYPGYSAVPLCKTFKMWSQLQGQLKGYLSDVAEQLPQLHGQLKEQINQHLTPLFPALGSGSAEEVIVGSRRVRILRQLGEGGYSTVYLTEEVVPRSDRSLQTQQLGPRPGQFALKKILVDGTDRLSEANNEIKVMQQVQHPNLMPLLDFSIVPSSGARASATHIAYLLFPLYVSYHTPSLVQCLLDVVSSC